MKNVLKWFGHENIESELEQELKLRHPTVKNETTDSSPGSTIESTMSSETQPSPRPEIPVAKEEIPDQKPDKKVPGKESLKTKSEL